MNGEAFEFKKDPDNDMYIGPDGCHHDSQAEAMYYGLGLCGCGCPVEVHELLIESAKCLDKSNGWDARKGVDGIKDYVTQHPDVVAEFIAHYLDSKEILHHGSSVYSSWLSDYGKQFIDIGVMDE